ncbi:MAG: hypothetical protein L6V84_09170 [Oscillospiraceae bacterium]|nr:MAG: hypothetical protein L6V84_09170 [Oscillospiraceae bacterium]
MDFVAYGVNHVTFSLACGGLEEEQTLTVWVNRAELPERKREPATIRRLPPFTVERVVENQCGTGIRGGKSSMPERKS